MNTILVVEDDSDICSLLKFTLEQNGYSVVTADNGEEALLFLKEHKPDLILLDLMLPRLSGTDVLKSIRYKMEFSLPVIIISAKTDESDIVTLLELGADDYLPKPFSLKVLLVKVKTLIQKEQAKNENLELKSKNSVLKIGTFEFDSERHRATLDGKSLDLSATEFSILDTLLSDIGRTFTRDELMEKAKGGEYYSLERTIDVQIASIRKKLLEYGSAIKTVWGVGYKWENDK